MGLAESALSSCRKMARLMIVGSSIGTGFRGAVADCSGVFELCPLFGLLCEKESGLSVEII